MSFRRGGGEFRSPWIKTGDNTSIQNLAINRGQGCIAGQGWLLFGKVTNIRAL
jgi:hypothetical protein